MHGDEVAICLSCYDLDFLKEKLLSKQSSCSSCIRQLALGSQSRDLLRNREPDTSIWAKINRNWISFLLRYAFEETKTMSLCRESRPVLTPSFQIKSEWSVEYKERTNLEMKREAKGADRNQNISSASRAVYCVLDMCVARTMQNVITLNKM